MKKIYICQSQDPSFQPSLHLSFIFEQSNCFFPNLLLTSLCISHIHLEKLSLFWTAGGWLCNLNKILPSIE